MNSFFFFTSGLEGLEFCYSKLVGTLSLGGPVLCSLLTMHDSGHQTRFCAEVLRPVDGWAYFW